MSEISDKDLKELRRIHEGIPQDLKDRLMRTVKVTPTMEKAVNMVLKEDLTEEQKKKFQNVKDSGLLSQKEEVVNRSVERQIDQYMTAEILKSVRAGRLSKPLKGSKLSKLYGG